MEIWSIAFSLFLLMDPIGNVPLCISALKGIQPKRQRHIIFRELFVALFIIILFAFLGNALMSFLQIRSDTIQIAGGIILFLICLKMIFPADVKTNEPRPVEEPFIVPIAVPLIAGPGVLAAVMIYGGQQTNPWIMVGAIMLAWLSSLIILLSSSWLKIILGSRGILAMEKLMGLVITLIAVEMFLNGMSSFINTSCRERVLVEEPSKIENLASMSRVLT